MTLEDRVLYPLLDGFMDGDKPLRARDLEFEPCPKSHAVTLTKKWHSRLPNTQDGPWTNAFHGHFNGVSYVVALWNSPSARTLPSGHLELRRLACAPDAPKNTPSRFLAYMARYFRLNEADISVLVSYQDTEVHAGTIYKAAGWTLAHTSKPRHRDRSGNRTGTLRKYRTNINGSAADGAAKIRWEYYLK